MMLMARRLPAKTERPEKEPLDFAMIEAAS
jgi:hypothetical protein